MPTLYFVNFAQLRDLRVTNKTQASLPRAKATQKPTRIQREKTSAILEAALEVFSKRGFRGATLDLIATEAKLSKPNLLYYFASRGAAC